MARRKARAVANAGGMAFGRNLMVLGSIVLALGLYGVVGGALTLTWPRAEATITSAETVRQIAGAGGSREESWNSFHVLYRYRVGDREYIGGRVEPYDFGMQNSAGAERMRDRHQIGSISSIAYDPGDPAIAYLEPGPSSAALMIAGVGAFMTLTGFWVRRKAAAGIGAMNEPGAPEAIARHRNEDQNSV